VTEAEWLQGNDLQQMVRHMHYRASARKFRLFEVACCRGVCERWTDVEFQEVLIVAEKYADGLATAQEMMETAFGGHRFGWTSVKKVARSFRDSDPQELTRQCGLLREVLGNPFFHQPVADLAWLVWNNRTAARVAADAYAGRQLPKGTLNPASLSLLADALEDAGCTDANLLGHLRSPGPHVRGCWAVDLVLGKE
jgi:hypothetical protein